MSETKGYAITLSGYDECVGYVVAESAVQAKQQVMNSVGYAIGKTTKDITSCVRVETLDGRPITTSAWRSIEAVPG